MGEKGVHGVLIALAFFTFCVVAVIMADGTEAEITGSDYPYYAPWSIQNDTRVTDEVLNLSMDVYVKGGELTIVNSTINIQVDHPHQYMFEVWAGATVIVVNSTLNLDTFMAESQASLNFEQGCVVKTKGRFYGECNSFFAEDTTFTNKAPDGVKENDPGEDATFIADGQVNSEFIRVTISNRGGNARETTANMDGARGGMAVLISNVTAWKDCTIVCQAGTSRGGGLGDTGRAGGNGGPGSDVVIELFSSYLENVDITAHASAGGVGARGANNEAGNAGDGGDGADGGDVILRLSSFAVLEIYGCNFEVASGTGGSGGNGGDATNGDGGTAGKGANAGTASIEISCDDDIIIEDSTINAIGGDGGYGGDYGRSSDPDGYGIPKPGGDGGMAHIEITSKVNLIASDIEVLARGGAGLDGGGGYDQGETGGSGGDGEVIIRAEAGIEASRIALEAIGGNGGNGGPATSEIYGNGGDGGDALLDFSGLLDMLVDHFSIYVTEGTGGEGYRDEYDGVDGIPTLDLVPQDNTGTEVRLSEGVFNLPLDDFAGDVRAYLYNVTFDMEFGIYVLPIGGAEAITIYPVTVRVVDDPDPSKAKRLEGYEVSVFHIDTGALVDRGFTNERGEAYFDLDSFRYTSLQVFYLGSYHFIAATPDGKTHKTVRGEIQGPITIIIVIRENTFPPEVNIEDPEDGTKYTFDKVETRLLEASGYVTDPDGSPITAMYVQLYPEKDDPNAWPKFKLGLSAVTLEDADPETRWGKYFPPGEFSNRWQFFFRFEVVGGDVLYENEAYLFEVTALDGVQTTITHVSIDIQIEPEQEPPRMRVYASVNPVVNALDLVEFNGTALNEEELSTHGVEVVFYAWDFDGDGELDFYSVENAATFHIYEDVKEMVTIRATLMVKDSLGRTVNITKPIDVHPPPVEEQTTFEQILLYMPVIIGVFLAILIAVGLLTVRARRSQAALAEEERKRIAEAMANIHECPRCGDLLEAKFATCPRCKAEDDLLEAQELIEELKESGIIVLEQEDLLEKALISFEGRDFDTAELFTSQAVEQAKNNALRYKITTEELSKVEDMIGNLTERGVDIPDVEMRIYHSKLALGRSDFDGAKEIADELYEEITKLDAESRKDELFQDVQRVEREVRTAKALGEIDTEPANRAIEAAKAAYGISDYVVAERKLIETEKLLKDPTWTSERDLEEEVSKKVEEEAMALSAAETAAIMEEERRKMEELAAISTKTDEGKIMSFADEDGAGEKEVVVDKGEVIDHVVKREEVVDHEVEPAPEVERETETAPEPEPEEEHVPAYHMGPPEEEATLAPEPEPSPKPVAAPTPKPVAAPKPAPAPKPVAAPAPKPAAAPKPAPAPAPKPLAAPKPAPAPVPKPAPEPEKEGEGDEKVPCSSCGKDIKAAWKKCPFCGEEQ